MDRAMDVTVMVFIEICDGVDDLAGFLGGCGIIKVD
jgi:hypothetical protein